MALERMGRWSLGSAAGARQSEGMNTPSDAGSTPVSVLVAAPVAAVTPNASVREVARVLCEEGIGAVLVGDREGPAGIVSERDVVGAVDDRRDPDSTQARDIANTNLVWCDADATAAEVAGLMMERYLRHVLVEQDGRLVGIVSARDLLGIYAVAEDVVGEEAR